jgi:hypothetical protein
MFQKQPELLQSSPHSRLCQDDVLSRILCKPAKDGGDEDGNGINMIAVQK